MERRACEVLLTAPMFTVQEQDKTLRIVPPICDRFKLFLEPHQGPYSGHLDKMHTQLSKQYWWPRMWSEVAHWRRASLTCATRSVGSVVKPPPKPIPGGRPSSVHSSSCPRTRPATDLEGRFLPRKPDWGQSKLRARRCREQYVDITSHMPMLSSRHVFKPRVPSLWSGGRPSSVHSSSCPITRSATDLEGRSLPRKSDWGQSKLRARRCREQCVDIMSRMPMLSSRYVFKPRVPSLWSVRFSQYIHVGDST